MALNGYQHIFTTIIFTMILSTSNLDLVALEQPKTVFLNYNENPFGAFPSVKKAMKDALECHNRYADDALVDFKNQLAAYHSARPDQILVGNGLSALMKIISYSFTGAEKDLITATPTFACLNEFAKERGAKVTEVPLKKNYSYDLDAMLAKVDASTKLVYICNPHNPTATLTPRSEIEAILSSLNRSRK